MVQFSNSNLDLVNTGDPTEIEIGRVEFSNEDSNVKLPKFHISVYLISPVEKF